MNSLEVSRLRAAELHAEAVASGHDPKASYALALAEAGKRDIEVAKVPKGNNRLYGGRAVYNPRTLLILHEDTGDEFTNAFLVAHEIGHVELGGVAELSISRNVDPLRPSEAAPVGVDRVADYSRRQRREVQMDLFARELLLPRSWLRRLHVEERLTAADIARVVQAPHDVVAQQLLDALLLPPPQALPEQFASAKPLTPDQASAATHEGSGFLLEAGPGTGKTQTLVGRVNHLLGRGVDPEKILILTFSNKAAGELAERIAARHPQAAAKIWAGTFHSFGLDIIRRFHDRLGLPVDPRLLDRTDAVGLLEDVYPTLNLVHFKNLWDPTEPLAKMLSAISRASDEVVDAAGYRAHAEAMLSAAPGDEEREAASRHLEVATVFAIYERLKAENGCVDFGDLVAVPVRLCELHADIRAHLAARYEHVLVDEYQDVNRSSVRLLKAICGDGRNLWVVGDVKQSIYRFRGASAYNMTRFASEDFPGATHGRLITNYRSRQEVVDAFLTFASEIPSVRGTEVGLAAERGAGGVLPEYRSVDFADQEVAAVAEAIEELRAAGYSYRDQAILSSGNDRLGRFADGLERLGIPVLYLGSLFERDEIKNLLSLISLLADGRAMGLVRLAATPDYPVPLSDIAGLIAHLKAQDCQPLAWTSIIGSLPGLSLEGRDGLQRIAMLLGGYGCEANPWTVLTTALLDRSRVAADIAVAPDVRGRARGIAIWQFMNFLRTQPSGSGLPATRLLQRIRRIVLQADERDLRHLPASAQGIDAVRLMTMHGCKGLEFPVVHIPGLAKGSLPRSPKIVLARSILPPDGVIDGAEGTSLDAMQAAIAEEHECLFFVALSRARDRLLMYSPTKASNGNRRQRSEFVDRLSDRIRSRHVVPKLQLPADVADAPVALTIDGPFAATDYQLGLYERCPRRFLYTHVLDVGGRRTESAFMRLHVAVQKVIDTLMPLGAAALTLARLKEALGDVWDELGPASSGHAEEYRGIATQLLDFLAQKNVGLETHPAPRLRLQLAVGEIVITPDQVVGTPGGTRSMRRVRTGHRQDKEEEGLAATAFSLAAAAHTPGCTAELVHLGDETITPVTMTPKKLQNRLALIEEMAGAVREGRFPQEETWTCPNCPAFFICGPLPAGKLSKKFSP
jgi:superfamily I DNA/RNA helicase/Zn-dependent peptidase ImmA (M78 family)